MILEGTRWRVKLDSVEAPQCADNSNTTMDVYSVMGVLCAALAQTEGERAAGVNGNEIDRVRIDKPVCQKSRQTEWRFIAVLEESFVMRHFLIDSLGVKPICVR